MSKELKLFAKIEVRWYDKVVKRTSFVFAGDFPTGIVGQYRNQEKKS